ncbi:MAG: hypothetical protein CR988_00330 [Treponema sp.]|nr:MAG: hypothetical protein CR988_00330 [Treponema sp.]
MTDEQWGHFLEVRENLKTKCTEYSKCCGKDLCILQKELAVEGGSPEYSVENSFVYNVSLDSVVPTDKINYIIVGDNPGKDEQLNKNRCYLVGHSGKLAESFFNKNSFLKTDFRKNVIILNKTPLHTAKTAQLKQLINKYEKLPKDSYQKNQLRQIFYDSQVFFANAAFKLQQAFNCELWIVGYSELKSRKVFEKYANCIYNLYSNLPEAKQKIYLFQHFSMNRFSIDLKKNYQSQLSLKENLNKIGTKHRQDILGF